MNQIDFSVAIGYLAVFLGFFCVFLMVLLIRSSPEKIDKRFPGGLDKKIDSLDIKAISLRPGSLLVVKVHHEINQEMADKIREAALSQLPLGVKVFVIGKSIDICAVLEDCSSNIEPVSNASWGN